MPKFEVQLDGYIHKGHVKKIWIYLIYHFSCSHISLYMAKPLFTKVSPLENNLYNDSTINPLLSSLPLIKKRRRGDRFSPRFPINIVRVKGVWVKGQNWEDRKREQRGPFSCLSLSLSRSLSLSLSFILSFPLRREIESSREQKRFCYRCFL